MPTTVLPLEQAAQAHRMLELRSATGRLVLVPTSEVSRRLVVKAETALEQQAISVN